MIGGLGRYGRNIVSNAGANAIHSVMQLGLLLVLIRLLDDTNYAAFLIATFLIGLLEMASDYGARIWATREFSITDQPQSVLRRSLQCKVFYTLLSACLAAMVPLNTLPFSAFCLCVLVAGTQPGTDPLLWFLRGKERLDVEAGVVLTFRTAVVLGMLACAFAGLNLNALLLVWLAGNVGRIAVEYRLPALQPVRISSAEQTAGDRLTAAKTLKYVFPIGTAFVLTALFQRATVFLLDIWSTPQDVKFYGTAFKVVSTSGFIATSVFVSSFAMLARAIEANNLEDIKLVIRRKLVLVTIVFLPVCIVGITCAVPLAGLFQSRDFSDIARVTVLLMPALYLSCINMGLKYTLNAFELNWHDVGAVSIGMAVLCGSTVFHGSLSWCEAAAMGWGLGEASLLIVRMGLLWKHKKHLGVPVGVIFGSTATLMLIIAVSYPGWAVSPLESSGSVLSTKDVPSSNAQLPTTN